ncbi:cyclase family protein [Oscillibacter sp. MSJ-2]|uniref:Cyclase family protein n=1 Tax=Dysosmobacter acutus TaxID=2841504 RepID=A0ABS6F8J2_9FIRM|nr:cyclase family protein [Dysosmobacter acutus]MBU5625897.1 cyclase family protein [Dysosmobacter acutus]
MILDLTHLIAGGMPVYPGTDSPDLSPAATLKENGCRETMLRMTSHTGTHMDAPAHMLPGGATLDALPVSRFCGRALVIDCTLLRGPQVTREVLRPYEREIERADFLLLRTGFEALWGTPEYYGDFAVPDREAMAYLTGRDLKGIGTDAISIDLLPETDFSNHMLLFGAGMVSIENLRLAAAPEGVLIPFCALPLHFHDSDGAPVRAIARLD